MSSDSLSNFKCQPYQGAEHRLTNEQIQQYLEHLPEWHLVEEGQAIARTLSFTDYYQTMAFVNAIAYMAHQQNHHPDLSVHYNRVVIRYSTHDVGGLSQNDFICAAKINNLGDVL